MKKKKEVVTIQEPNQEAAITVENIDPAWVYSVDTDKLGTRGFGIVVRVTHDLGTKQELAEEKRRFFVFEAGAEYPPFSMNVDEAVSSNIKRERRSGPEEVALFDRYLETI
jgi:hypothetical protein